MKIEYNQACVYWEFYMESISFKQYFSKYLNDPLSKELEKGQKIFALVSSVAIGIFSLGIVHLSCYLYFKNRRVSLIDEGGKTNALYRELKGQDTVHLAALKTKIKTESFSSYNVQMAITLIAKNQSDRGIIRREMDELQKDILARSGLTNELTAKALIGTILAAADEARTPETLTEKEVRALLEQLLRLKKLPESVQRERDALRVMLKHDRSRYRDVSENWYSQLT